MPFEAKDYLTFTFSAAALAVSLYNLVRARRDAKSLNYRVFEQKRFEATMTANEIIARYTEGEGVLATLRYEALRAGNSSIAQMAEERIQEANARRSDFESVAQDLIEIPPFSGDLKELNEIEKPLGMLKSEEKSMSQYKALTLNFVESGRRMILAQTGQQ